MRAPVSRMPTLAAPIARGVEPHPFVSLTRRVSLPMLVWTIMRSDWLSNLVEAGSPSIAAAGKQSGLVLHVPTQWSGVSEYATRPPFGLAGGVKNQNPRPT